jgi:type IV secretory pathway VirB4 component
MKKTYKRANTNIMFNQDTDMISLLAHLAKDKVSFCHHLASVVCFGKAVSEEIF